MTSRSGCQSFTCLVIPLMMEGFSAKLYVWLTFSMRLSMAAIWSLTFDGVSDFALVSTWKICRSASNLRVISFSISRWLSSVRKVCSQA